MEGKRTISTILYAIALALGVATLVFSYTGLAGNLDAEPLLGIGLLFVALAGLNTATTNK